MNSSDFSSSEKTILFGLLALLLTEVFLYFLQFLELPYSVAMFFYNCFESLFLPVERSPVLLLVIPFVSSAEGLEGLELKLKIFMNDFNLTMNFSLSHGEKQIYYQARIQDFVQRGIMTTKNKVIDPNFE